MRNRSFWKWRRPARHAGVRWLFPRRGGLPGRPSSGVRRRRTRRTCHASGIGLEPLEARALLATTVSADNLMTFKKGGDFYFDDETALTVSENLVIDAAGGNVTFSAPVITLQPRVQIVNADRVDLKAEKKQPDMPLSVWGQAETIIQAINDTKASVTLGESVSIASRSLSISTTAGDDQKTDSIPLSKIVDHALELVSEVLELPVSVQYKQPRSAIEIGSGTQLVTAGDVTIASEATANATGQAIWSVLADWLVKKAAGLQTQQGFGFAAGFSYADAAATALVAENAQITAGGRVAITTAVNSSAQMKSMVILNEGLQQTNPNNIEVAYAGATTKATSRVTVAAGATVAAQKNVDIHASATSATGVKPKTASYRDGMAGVTVGTGFTEGVVEVIVGGSIIAGQVSVPAPLTFNPALTVDFDGRSLIFPGDVGFRTGDEVIYSTGVGAAIPGLVDGTRYFAIVDPAQPTRLRLAASAADASAGRAIDLGAGYPTLTTAKGTLPIVSIDAGASDTLWFGFDRWPDGSPLFTTGDTVQYRALAGHSIGQTDAAGQLLGALPDGTYRVEVVPGNRGDVGLRIRLLDAHGGRVHLDTSPQFVTDSGAICRVDSFDADAATVTFIGAGGGGSAVPGQQVPLTNGQRIRYVQAFGMLVPGLVDGRDYYAVVDPAAPGVIQLAESEPQAQAANPAIQNAAPTLETQDADPARRRTIAIGDVQPGTGLVFGTDPQLPAGTPVTYRAVPGKPVDGLVDGVTYYAYPQVNPYFEPNFPQYVVGLRNAADPSAPLIEHQLLQSLSAGGTDFVINGIDASAGALSLALPQRAPAVSADSSQLVGGAAVIAAVPPGSPQLWTNATGGTFLISLPNGAARALTAPIPFSATASAVAQAINAVGIPGISVATAYGRGRSASPWTLVGSGLDDLVFDWTALNAGAAVWSRLAVDGLEAVSTTATGGTFTLTLDVAGTSRTTAPLRVGASATEVRSALNAIPGALAGMVTGSGTATDPWLIGSRVQPLRTGDAVVFRDAWGSASPGLLDGQTFYAVVAPIGEQGRDDSVVIRLAATRDAALVPNPSPVPLATTLAFEPAATQVMAGAGHTLTSRVAATGINLAVSLDSSDSQAAKSQNGSAPGWKELLTQGDFVLAKAVWAWQDWKSSNSAAERTAEGRIRDKLGAQEANPWLTASASTCYLKVSNTARVVVESTATLRTIGSVSITSDIVERLSSSVDATVSRPTEDKLAVAVAVDIVSVSNTSHATVESGASITGGRGVTVHAQTVYPWPVAWLSPFRGGSWASPSQGDDLDEWKTALGVLQQTATNALGIFGRGSWQNLLVSHYSGASIKPSDELKVGDKLAVTVAGTCSWITISNDTVARIEDGASINQDDTAFGGAGGLRVTALTDVTQFSETGNGYRGVSGRNSLGASVGYLEVANTTRALLGGLETGPDGRPLRSPAGPLRVRAGMDGVTVDATTDTLLLQLSLGGTKATTFGFSGMASVLDAARQSQVTEAAIEGPVDATRKAVIVSAGSVDVRADDTTYLIPVAGAVVLADSKGAGGSTALAFLDRGVTARLGARDEAADATVGTVDVLIGAGGGGATTALEVEASAGGAVTPVALAADVVSDAKPAGEPQHLEDIPVDTGNAGNKPAGVFGLAVSGDFSLADVDDAVQATVNTKGTIASSSTAAALRVAASNTTTIQASGGAAAYLKQNGDGSSLTLAGSAALLEAASKVIGSVRRATLSGSLQLDVSARNERLIGNQAASGSGRQQNLSRQGEWSGQFAGSVTINMIKATTTATIDGVTAGDLSGVTTAANTQDTIWSAAGSFLLNFSPAGGQAAGKSLGVGEAFAWNKLDVTTQATIVDSTLTLPAGSLSVEAVDASRVFTFAAGIILSGAGSSLGGMFALVTANSSVTAEVDGATIDVATGAVEVAATSMLLLVTAAGDYIVGRGQGSWVAAGAAVAVVGGAVASTARVRGGSVRVRRGSLSVTSQTLTPDSDPAIEDLLSEVSTPHRDQTAVWSFAVGVVMSGSDVSADFSVCVNTLTSTREASIEESARVTIDGGSLAVRAIDEAAVYSGAGAIAVAIDDTGRVAGGAAVVRNKVSGTTKALIDVSNVIMTVGDSVAVEAVGAGFIGTAAVGGQVAGLAALGTAVVLNDIVQRIDARILGNAAANSGLASVASVSVTATERSTIGAGAGQVDIATKGAAAGAAAAVNTIDSQVNAIIEQARVTSSSGGISVKADAASDIEAYAVGVAGAFRAATVQFAGAGSGTGNTLARQVTAAVQSNAVLEGPAVRVEATDSSTIDTAAGALAIQYSGTPGLSAAVGVSVSTNAVGDDDQRSFVRALVSESQVTVHGDMSVLATSTLAVQAITAAGAGDVGGGGTPVGIAGAGSGSRNTVQMDVTAAVQDSTVLQDVANGVTITATNDTKVLAIAGGIAVAGSGAGKPGGVGVTVGAAASVNTVDLRTWALVEGSTSIVSPGPLTVTAGGDAAVEAVAFGVAGALRAGGSTFDLSGAGSASVNSVTMDTQAAIRDADGHSPMIGSASQPLSAVSVKASDTSSIVAGAGALASLFSFGQGSALGLSIGVSFSINEVSGNVSAAIEDAIAFAAGDVAVSAEFSPGQNDTNIQCITVAGAVGATAAGGALFDLAGSGSRNTVSVTTTAVITGGAGVRAGGGVSVAATDTSVIKLNAGGIGLGLALGGGAFQVAVGAAYGKNEVRDTVQAWIEHATVTAGAGVAVTATAKPHIETVGYGVALSATLPGSVSAAGSSAWAYNTVANTVEAAILGAEVTAQTGDVVVQADDEPTISTKAGAGALAVALGDGVAIAPGVVILESSVTDRVTARIGRSDRSTVEPNVTASQGALTVQATSAATVTSLGVAVAASVAVGDVTVALAGGGASSTVKLGSTTTAAIEAGTATGMAVKVLAVDRDAVAENTVGAGALAIGVVGGSLGVSLAETRAANTVAARIGGTDDNGTPSVIATAGGIMVDVRGGHNLAARSVATAVAIALGATGAGGHAFTTDTSTYRATVATGASLQASGTLVVQARGSNNDPAAPDGQLQAQADGGSGGLVAVGVVIASATDGTQREATIGDGVDLSGVAALDLVATSSPNVKAQSTAVDVGGVAVTVNQSIVTTAGKATASTGRGVTLPQGDTRILANGASRLFASQTGVVSGVLAAGATQTTGASGLATEATLGPDTRTAAGRSGGLVVRATSMDSGTSISATSGSGGLFAGFGTSGELTDTTTTRAQILGGTVHAGAVDVGVVRRNTYGISVDSTNMTVVLGVGITRASFTANPQDADATDRVRVTIADDTAISAQDRVHVSADHSVYRDLDRSTVDGVGGSLVEGNQAVSNVTAWVPATIDIGNRVSITSGSDIRTRPGGITLLPTGSLDIDDSASLANLGLLVDGGHMATYLKGGVTPQVTLGNDVALVSHGQLAIGTTAFVDSSASTNGWGKGLFGGIGTYATSDMTVDQKVSIGDRVVLKTDGSLSLTPGDDPTTGSTTFLTVDATARASSTGVVAVPKATARTTLTRKTSLDFGSNGNVSSGGSMYLSARPGQSVATASGRADGDVLGFPKTDTDEKVVETTTSTVTLQGTFLAGRENRLEIVIAADPSGGAAPTMKATPDEVFGVPAQSALSYAADFNPQSYIRSAGYSPEVESALLSGVAAGTVGAVSLQSQGPLMVSGGSVTIVGDTISAANTSITARVATISIRNESPAYLIVGSGLAIANVEGGRVDFTKTNGDVVQDPTGAVISRDESSTPTIEIELTYDPPVGGSHYGPALFVGGGLENVGGDVTIKNAAGSFGQSGTIVAKQITIDTPNGVYAVDTPNHPWNTSGTPAAMVVDSLIWPGGRPGLSVLPSANQAVMYAILAGAGNPTWRGLDEFALNQAVYGNPLDPNGEAWVFFGGSTPQFINLDGNTKSVNEARAAESRPDGSAIGWQMTSTFEGGAHAWMPQLEGSTSPPPFSLPKLVIDQRVNLPRGTARKPLDGQVIVINASVANINGTIQVGGGTTQTQSVVLESSLEATLRETQKNFQAGNTAQSLYRIPADQLRTKSAGDMLIGASFDARTGQILLDQATSTGGGSVSITGKLINTAGLDATNQLLGKIKVQGGSGAIDVRNETSLPLVTGNLRTSRGAQQAVVRITDLNITDETQRQTAYVYDGTGINVYTGAAGVDLPSTTSPREYRPGATTQQSPRANARWVWTEQADMIRSVTGTDVPDPDNWSGVTTSGWSFTNTTDPAGPWQTIGGEGEGRVDLDNPSPWDLTQSMTGTTPDGPRSVRPNYALNDWGFADGFRFMYPERVSLAMTMSLKADWPIGIDFSGTTFGQITVSSVGDVVVAGGTVSTAVTIDSSDGGIMTTSGGIVDATRVVLSAKKGIGNAASAVGITAASVAASTSDGDAFLDGRGDDTTAISLENLWAPNGSVSIVATGDLVWKSGSVRAVAVSLISEHGSIGTLANPLVTEAVAGGRLRFDASAAGDIFVNQATGDMLVGVISSSGSGSVQLDVDGTIYNANTWTIDPVASDERINALESLGATTPDAYKADVESYAKNVTSRYTLYWSTRQNADNLNLWRPRAAVAYPNPTDQEIRTYVAALRASLEGFFADTFGSGWASLPQFGQFDASYRYVATQADIKRFSENRYATRNQLARTMLRDALDTPPVGESVSGPANIVAGTLRLVSRRGSVGKNDQPVTITGADLAAGTLTDLQKQELALAATPGDATRTADGGLVLQVRRPIILTVTGQVDVLGPAGVAIAQKTGDLWVGRVSSDNGLVSVIADGSILNADTTIDMWGTAIGFDRPSDWNLVGDANQQLSAGKLFIPGFKNTASGTWFNRQVPTGSFRASFIYRASAPLNPGDGLAFVLQEAGTGAVGDDGSGLGYRGISGSKVGFLINVFQDNTPGVFFDKDGSWGGGQFQKVPFPLTDRPVYVNLVHDALAGTMTVTVSDQPQLVGGARSFTVTYRDVNLASVLGPTAFMGFTSGTGNSVTTQQVSKFAFSSDDPLEEEHVTFTTPAAWVTNSSDAARGGFVLTSPSEGPTFEFPNLPNLAAAAWYPDPVRISTDFRVTFRYWFSSTQAAQDTGNGMALVFQNSPDGVRALGTTGSGLGYTGIPGKKVGYLINIFPGDAQGSGTGVRFDASGAAGGPYNQIDFSRFDETWIDVSLTYDAEAKTLKEVLTWNDGVEDVPIRSATIPNIDLPELLGGNEATLGITVSSGAAYAEQRIQGLDFRSPAAVRPDARPEWQLNGSVQSLANGSLTIPVVPNTVTSTWYGREVSTDGFEAAFTYTVSDWNADVAAFGIAFVLQQSPAGFAAIGASGDALGYADMPGPKAGFLLTVRNGGTAPVLFAGVDDGSGSATSEQLGVLMGPVSVTLSYDAQTRTLSAVVTSTGIAQYTRTWTVDLPQLLGKQAILGITSGTTLFALSTPTQTITNFIFKGRDGIESLKPGGDSTPTVRLWTTHGDIGASGDEINVRGKLQADAPQGEIHTNPPPSPSIRLVREGGRRPDGMLMTNVGRVTVTRSSPDNTILYSVNGGRTWRPRFQAVEGLNDVLVVQVNTRGFRSSPSRLQFVLDRSSPPAPRVTVLQRAGVLSGTGQLSITGLRRQAVVEYSVNGGAWSSTYTPVEGRNVVRIRQTDLAGNRSLPSVVRFVLKTRVGRLIVALRHPDPDRVEPVTSDGKLLIRGRERGAFVQYSTDGGASWRRSFRPALGLNRLAVRQVDRVGNVSEPTAFEFTFEVQTRGGRRLGMAWWLGGKA